MNFESASIIAEQVIHESPSGERPDTGNTALSGPIVWDRDSLPPDAGFLRLSARCLHEIRGIVELLRRNPLPDLLLEPAAFDLESCARLMREAREMLQTGIGFVIIDRLPIEDFSVEESRAVYWILSQLVSRPVAQSWDGKMIYDVRDLGKPPGNGVRPDITNAEQNFHTDNSYNLYPPDYVALLCLRPAMEGGISSIVSFYTVYNEMQRRCPDLVDRLYESYLFDRQMEQAPGEAKVLGHPLFQTTDGRLLCRLSHRHVINGYRMAGTSLDARGADALERLESIMREPRLCREFVFEPGQIQIIDNTRCGHRRTAFTDFPEDDRKRHLIRLWLRDRGRRFYNG